MSLKRILTSLIGMPIITLIIIFSNEYIIDVVLTITAVICMFEYFKVIEKASHPIKWIGYFSTIIIALVAFFELEVLFKIIIFGIPFIILFLFLHIIISEMKITFKDVAYTFLGIFYISIFIMFLGLIRNLNNGKVLLGYVFIIAWTTDIFGYLIGKHFGKHFFSKISPKKTIEGSVAGIIGTIIFGTLYILIANNYWGLNINSYLIIGISALLSIISQVGDFAASSIKRFVDIKDYGNFLPGHGGMLDRIDSLIFIAPFAYMIFSILI